MEVMGCDGGCDDERDDDVDGVSEGLKRVRTKRRSAGARAKGRRDFRRKKTKIRRARKLRNRKPVVKRAKAKLKRLKKGRSAGRRAMFVVTSADYGPLSKCLAEAVLELEVG